MSILLEPLLARDCKHVPPALNDYEAIAHNAKGPDPLLLGPHISAPPGLDRLKPRPLGAPLLRLDAILRPALSPSRDPLVSEIGHSPSTTSRPMIACAALMMASICL